MATSSNRVLWKGAITFGLVHIPVALHAATQSSGIDFDWLDKRTMDPVGYKRVNKKTGKEVEREQIVKGVAVEKEHYVVLTDDEIKAAYPKATQTIEIERFVPAGSIPFVYLERPYYLAPANKGDKVYALLREALLKAQRVALARVVIQTKQHLAVVVPDGPALVLDLLRWGDEIRDFSELPLPAEGAKANGLKERELEMALQLIDDMSGEWKPDDFHDSFSEQVMQLVQMKVESGQTQEVLKPESVEAPGASAEVVDLTALLQRSLKKPPHKAGNTAAKKRQHA
ncbi:MAG TPA: Ku protein [Burkholderiaceae bacterium]